MKEMKATLVMGVLLFPLTTSVSHAAIGLDRTRVIFDGSQKSVSMTISNQNKELPYLAQGWLEDAQGNKVSSPLVVVPPVQRVEPGAKSQIKVQALPAVNALPQDKESLFYFNLREIPPKSDKPNTLQIALQTKIKLFYRPASLMRTRNEMSAPWQQSITLNKVGDKYQVNNPTAYFVTLVDGSRDGNGAPVSGFEPLMVAPKGQGTLKVNASTLGDSPVLTFIDDYGGRPKLKFTCSGSTCTAEMFMPKKNG